MDNLELTKVIKLKYLRVYLSMCALMDKNPDEVYNGLISDSLDDFLVSKMKDQFEELETSDNTIELAYETLSGKGKFSRVNPSYKDEMIEIIKKYNDSIIKKLEIKK